MANFGCDAVAIKHRCARGQYAWLTNSLNRRQERVNHWPIGFGPQRPVIVTLKITREQIFDRRADIAEHPTGAMILLDNKKARDNLWMPLWVRQILRTRFALNNPRP